MIHDTLLPWCSYLDWEPEPVDHDRRQRAAPGARRWRVDCQRPAARTCSNSSARCRPRRRSVASPATEALRAHRRSRGLRPRPLRRCGRLGRREPATARGRSPSAAPSSPPIGAAPASWPAAASSPTSEPLSRAGRDPGQAAGHAVAPSSAPDRRDQCRDVRAESVVDDGSRANVGSGEPRFPITLGRCTSVSAWTSRPSLAPPRCSPTSRASRPSASSAPSA